MKTFRMDKLHVDFDFGDADDEDAIFVCASQVLNYSVELSY